MASSSRILTEQPLAPEQLTNEADYDDFGVPEEAVAGKVPAVAATLQQLQYNRDARRATFQGDLAKVIGDARAATFLTNILQAQPSPKDIELAALTALKHPSIRECARRLNLPLPS